MKYDDGSSLRTYLKNNFNKFIWKDKSNLAFQLTCAVSFLNDNGIVHGDLVNYYFN